MKIIADALSILSLLLCISLIIFGLGTIDAPTIILGVFFIMLLYYIFVSEKLTKDYTAEKLIACTCFIAATLGRYLNADYLFLLGNSIVTIALLTMVVKEQNTSHQAVTNNFILRFYLASILTILLVVIILVNARLESYQAYLSAFSGIFALLYASLASSIKKPKPFNGFSNLEIIALVSMNLVLLVYLSRFFMAWTFYHTLAIVTLLISLFGYASVTLIKRGI